MSRGPQRTEPHALPDDLRTFLGALAEKLAADPDLLAHDADAAFADRLSPDVFEITYLTADDWKWTFNVAPGELATLAAEGARVPLWVCGDAACGYRFSEESRRCPRCDEAEGDRETAGLGRLLADLFGEGGKIPKTTPPPAAAPPAVPTGADRLLAMLVEQGQVELEPGADRRAIAAGMDALLAVPEAPDAQASKLIDWLLDQPGVEEVYAADDELSRLLEAW